MAPWYGEPRYTRSHYLFLAFVGWICLTYPTALNTDRAYPFFVEYVKIFVMFICATLVLRSVRDLWLIYFVVLFCAIYVGYEIRSRYKFRHRTPYDFYAHAGPGAAADFGVGI